VGVSLEPSDWNAWGLRRWGPLLVAGHALNEEPVLTWGGVAVPLGGGPWERRVVVS
jgi:hypothetical protein